MSKYELQAQIAKEITLAIADKIRIPRGLGSSEKENEIFTDELCKFYTRVFETVKELTKE